MAIKIEHFTKTTDLTPPDVITDTHWDANHKWTMLGPAILGRQSATEGNVMELSATQAKTLLALENVNNTADADKPISTLQAAGIDGRVPKTDEATVSDIRAKTVHKFITADKIDEVRRFASPASVDPRSISSAIYFGPIANAIGGSLSMAANRIYFVPLYIGFDYDVTFLSMVTTTNATVTTNLGIYDTDPLTGLPTGTPTYIGNISGSGTGVKKSSLVGSKTVGPGFVWAACVSNTTHSVLGVAAANMFTNLGWTIFTTTATIAGSFYGTTTFAAGALPDFSAVTALTNVGAGVIPAIFLGGP